MMCPEDTRIGFLSSGVPTAALEAAVRLIDAGYDVFAGPHDPRAGVVLEDAGITCLSSVGQVVRNCDVILTACARMEDVEELYFGEDSIFEEMEPGGVCIDLSFTTAQLAREIQAVGAVSEVDFVDCPLVNLGEQEEAIAFVGGEKRALEHIAPLLPFLASNICPLEEPGEGQMCAAVAYIGLAGSIMGAIEAMSFAKIAGISNKAALNALASTSAASRALIDYVPRMIGKDFSGRIKVIDFLDVLDIALLTAESLEITLPMTETAYQLYDLLGVVGGDEMSIQALALLYEDEKTCAEHGLDWSLAEQRPPAGFEGEEGGDPDLREILEQAIEASGLDLSGDTPKRRVDNSVDNGIFGGLNGFDIANGPSGPQSPNGPRHGNGYPPASSFFSRN